MVYNIHMVQSILLPNLNLIGSVLFEIFEINIPAVYKDKSLDPPPNTSKLQFIGCRILVVDLLHSSHEDRQKTNIIGNGHAVAQNRPFAGATMLQTVL